MLEQIINDIKEILKTDDNQAVYSAFDGISYSCKQKDISTFVGINEFETKKPILSPFCVYIPFNAVVSLSINAPAKFSANLLYNYLENVIIPRLSTSNYNVWAMKNLTIKPDSNLNKLVLKCEFGLSGIFKTEVDCVE